MSVMMGCGHAANAKDGNGDPVCAICALLDPRARTVVDTPDLTGRTAICSYTVRTGGTHTTEQVNRARDRGYRLHDGPVPSHPGLAFFAHQPGEDHDRYYCGCWGWGLMAAFDRSVLRPGAYIEVRPKPWRGYVRTEVTGDRFLADPEARGVDWQAGMPTSWSADAIESVRILAAPVDLPTVPGTQFVGVSLAFPEPAVWAVYRSAVSGSLLYVMLAAPAPGDEEGAAGVDDVMVPATEAAARGLRVTGAVRPPLTVDGE